MRWRAAAIGLALAAAAAEAQPVPPLDQVQQLIEAGELARAETVLGLLDPSDPEVQFWQGQVAEREGHWADAERIYRQILARDPDLPRARLELARALFEERDDVASEFQFRLALAGDLPPGVVETIGTFLARLRARRRLSFDVAAGGIADSNMNRAPALDEVGIFGLSFILSQQAKQKSGFGVDLSADGEYAPRLTGDTRLRAGATFDRRDYQGGAFDDMQVQAYAGPQFERSWGEFSLLGLVLKRWFGNTPYHQGYGGRAEAGWNVTNRYRADGYVQIAQLWYPTDDFLNGYQVDTAIVHTYALTSASYLRGLLGIGHQDAKDPAWRNDYGRVGLGYGRDIPWGISLYAELSGTYFSYEAQFFGADRSDWLAAATLTAVKGDWPVFGFLPQVTVGYQRNISTVALFQYQRVYAELGFTRHF